MEFIEGLLGVGLSAASGGIFGLVGSGLAGVAKYFQRKQEQEFKKEAWGHEYELLKLQMQSRSQETENELAIVSQGGSYAGLKESIKADQKDLESYRWVNAIRSLFRPILTTLLLVICFSLFRDILTENTLMLEKQAVTEILKYIVYSLVFSSGTAIVWWFGDRAFCPPGMKNR
jgi:hypothetical protein